MRLLERLRRLASERTVHEGGGEDLSQYLLARTTHGVLTSKGVAFESGDHALVLANPGGHEGRAFSPRLGIFVRITEGSYEIIPQDTPAPTMPFEVLDPDSNEWIAIASLDEAAKALSSVRSLEQGSPATSVRDALTYEVLAKLGADGVLTLLNGDELDDEPTKPPTP